MYATILASGEVILGTEGEDELLLAVEEGEAEPTEAENPILPATEEVVWGAIAFVILFVLLAKFAYPAVKQGMDNRTERIRSNLDDAERTRAEAQSVLEDYQRQLADARSEAARIIEDARQTADGLRRDLEAKAQAEMAELRQRNTEQLAAERERTMAELRDQVKVLAIELAERVLEANLDRDANIRLLDQYLEQVGNGSRGT